jgi:anti-anti-sigma factor
VNQLIIAVHVPDDGVRRLALAGEIDAAGAIRLGAAIEQAVVVDRVDELIIDLAAVRFLDSVGVDVLVTGHSLAIENCVAFQVINARDGMHPVINIGRVLCGHAPDAHHLDARL